MSYSFMVSLCLAYPLGALADRLHPLRLTMVGMGLHLLVMLASALFTTDARSCGVALIAQSILAGAFYTVSLSLPQKLLPRDKFASIASAGGTIGCVVGIVFAPAVGFILDRSGHDYTLIYYIGCAVAALALIANIVLYSKFITLGGPKNYVAP